MRSTPVLLSAFAGRRDSEHLLVLFIKAGIILKAAFCGRLRRRTPGQDFLMGTDQPLFYHKCVDGDIHLLFKKVAQCGYRNIARGRNFRERKLSVDIMIDIIGEGVETEKGYLSKIKNKINELCLVNNVVLHEYNIDQKPVFDTARSVRRRHEVAGGRVVGGDLHAVEREGA